MSLLLKLSKVLGIEVTEIIDVTPLPHNVVVLRKDVEFNLP